jgi:hypothetical protein
MLRDLTQYFPHGWAGLNRDEAIFNFAQGNAVFISTGIWEAEAISLQAKGKFDIGIMDFPLPKSDDPEYGPYLRGPRYENPDGGMSMAITNTSAHPDIARDFLLFLTSQEQNAKFNAHVKWLPIITGAEVGKGLEVFEPRAEGVFPALDTSIGPESVIRWEQLYTLYQIDQISFEGMAAQFKEFFRTVGAEDCREFIRNMNRGQVRRAQFAVNQRQRALAQPQGTPAAEADWLRYRSVGDSILYNELGATRLDGYLRDPEKARAVRPFTYTPGALRAIAAAASAKPLPPQE